MSAHLEDFTLLRIVASEVKVDGVSAASRHLRACAECTGALDEIRRVDSGLRRLAEAEELSDEPVFEADDPFRRRPAQAANPRASRRPLAEIIEASHGAEAVTAELLETLRSGEDIAPAIARLSLEAPSDRYGLLYALQEAGRRSAEYPLRARDFAHASIAVLRRRRSAAGSELAERLVPRLVLRGQAHTLLGMACLWTQEAARGRAHLIVAYRSFARGGADEVSLALVELIESQRRALSGHGGSSLALARRCRQTFEERGISDYAARAVNAEGLAHTVLEQHEKALQAFRDAQAVFESHGLWANYVGALSGSATSLARLGRIPEARRDYARALRRYSRREHRSWIGYLQVGLAETLFNAGRFVEAAASARRAAGSFGDTGLRVQRLLVLLLEIDCWAHHGSPRQALSRLEAFRTEIRDDGSAHEASLRRLAKAVIGANATYESVSRLRRQIGDRLSRSIADRRA